MNKEQIILQLADKWFGRDSLESHNSSSDFTETAVWCIKGALEAAYEAGLSAGYKQGQQSIVDNTQATPKKRLCATVLVEAANCSVSVQEPLQGIINVMLIGANGMTEHELDVTEVDNVEYMSTLFGGRRVDVFMQLMHMLAAIHTHTIVWDNA